jgi:hypothetical protein
MKNCLSAVRKGAECTLIDDDSSIEIQASKRQSENRMCRITNTMAIPFLNTTSVKQRTYTKFGGKRIKRSMNADA